MYLTSVTYALLSILVINTMISPTKSSGVEDALTIFKVGKAIGSALTEAWDIVENNYDLPEPLQSSDKKHEKKLFDRLAQIQLELETLNSEINTVGTSTLYSFMHYLPEAIKLELRLNTLLQCITQMNGFYDNMKSYTNNTDFERETLMNYAKSVTSHSEGSVRSLLGNIHSFVVPADNAVGITDTGILTPIANALKETAGDMVCNAGQSPQQVLYNLYNTIELTEMKGYIMMQFSYMLLRFYNKGNFTQEAHLVKDQFNERTASTIKSIKMVLEPASRELWKCDPKEHVKDETYIEVTQLLQGYIENEVDMNSEGTCSETCEDYTYAKNLGCYQNLFCQKQRKCNGKILNCKFIDSHMSVCPAGPLSGKRYEYVEYENGRVFGHKQHCSNNTIQVDSWWRWLFLWHCSYCFCLCDDQSVYSDRFINMRSAISDIKNNMVITGLRFAKKNRIIHIQIQEGKLLPMGNIDPKTVHWVPVEEYNITDNNIYKGQDYHILTWEHRSIDLDDLETDEKHVLTGVRFKKIASHLNFEIYQTAFDFQTGSLLENAERSMWKDNSNTEASLKNPRTQLRLKDPDVPIRGPASLPDSKSDQYIEFTNSGLERDAAQTTVPFFDSQPVDSLIPVPLSGAGIYHKGQKNFGGFIGLKIFTYDFSQHLYVPLPKVNAVATIQK